MCSLLANFSFDDPEDIATIEPYPKFGSRLKDHVTCYIFYTTLRHHFHIISINWWISPNHFILCRVPLNNNAQLCISKLLFSSCQWAHRSILVRVLPYQYIFYIFIIHIDILTQKTLTTWWKRCSISWKPLWTLIRFSEARAWHGIWSHRFSFFLMTQPRSDSRVTTTNYRLHRHTNGKDTRLPCGAMELLLFILMPNL